MIRKALDSGTFRIYCSCSILREGLVRRLLATVLVALLGVPLPAAAQVSTPPPPRTVPRPALPAPTLFVHQPADCMVAAANPLIEATRAPEATVSSVRVHYRSSQASDFSTLDMTLRGEQWQACLPPPIDGAGSVTYFITAAGADGVEQRSPAFTALVVRDAGQCADRRMAPLTDCAIAGTPPPGFGSPVTQTFGGGSGLFGSKAFLIAGGAVAVGLTAVVLANDKDPQSGSR
jgi:hypothetical protein